MECHAWMSILWCIAWGTLIQQYQKQANQICGTDANVFKPQFPKHFQHFVIHGNGQQCRTSTVGMITRKPLSIRFYEVCYGRRLGPLGLTAQSTESVSLCRQQKLLAFWRNLTPLRSQKMKTTATDELKQDESVSHHDCALFHIQNITTSCRCWRFRKVWRSAHMQLPNSNTNRD